MQTLQIDKYKSPLGLINIVAAGDELYYLGFADNRARMQKMLAAHYAEFNLHAVKLPKLRMRLDAYFGGDFSAFAQINIKPIGTKFQMRVWRALQKIPAGKTLSYKKIAQKISNPAAVRAVGGACARNPIAIVIPCHRVIGADESLTGYAAGTIRKAQLLKHEGVV